MRTITSLVLWSVLLMCCASVGFAQGPPPFPGAVWINGNWIPCDHPIAIRMGYGCSASALFRVRAGATYEHIAGGWRFYIVGPVQRQSGAVVIIAEVIRGTDRIGRELFPRGTLIEVTPEWVTTEWTELR